MHQTATFHELKEKVINLSGDADFELIGISSKLSMHKLSWQLNQLLAFDFRRLDEDIDTAKDRKFSVYQYDAANATYILLENKSRGALLLKKLPNIDYLLKIEGDLTDSEFKSLIKKIRQVPDVYACLNIELSVLSKKEIDLLI